MDIQKITPLMCKATALWLIENTSLTFEQIADFCNLHILEIKAMADDEVSCKIKPMSPIETKQLSKSEILRCENNDLARLQINISNIASASKSKYIPLARRRDKPNAILWLIRNCSELSDTEIAKLIGSTKNTVNSIREKIYWNMENIKAKDPVLLGLCSQGQLNDVYSKAKSRVDNN